MDSADRVVSILPLAELWDERGSVGAKRVRPVGQEDVRALLRRDESLRFVVAEAGQPLRWVAPDDRFRFWKEELAPHLVEPSHATQGFALDDLPGGLGYVADEADGRRFRSGRG